MVTLESINGGPLDQDQRLAWLDAAGSDLSEPAKRFSFRHMQVNISACWWDMVRFCLLSYGGRNLEVDLGAELPIGAEKGKRRIAVEVKSFIGKSEVVDLEDALGQ